MTFAELKKHADAISRALGRRGAVRRYVQFGEELVKGCKVSDQLGWGPRPDRLPEVFTPTIRARVIEEFKALISEYKLTHFGMLPDQIAGVSAYTSTVGVPVRCVMQHDFHYDRPLYRFDIIGGHKA